MEEQLRRLPALFLDRDGVLNRRIMGGYVTQWQQFEWLPGVLDALRLLAPHFYPIVIVSNQQGVAKGLMTEADLEVVNQQMLQEITQAGGRVDRIFTCTSPAAADDPRRKPGIGMYFDALAAFPDLPWQQKIMVGDTLSDMQFGQAAGMECVWIDYGIEEIPGQWFNHRFSGLLDWAYSWLNRE